MLKLIPDAARQADFSYLQFSRQMLRGAALDAVKDRNARGFWLEMLPGTKRPFQRPAIELALALHDERAGALDGLFAPGSPVRSPDLREILLTNVAGPALLRRQARDPQAPKHERDLALVHPALQGPDPRRLPRLPGRPGAGAGRMRRPTAISMPCAARSRCRSALSARPKAWAIMTARR